MSRHKWTEQSIGTLREHYPDRTAKEVAALIGCSVSAAHQKAVDLGIRKSEAFIQSERSGRISRANSNDRMKATRFKKGQDAWNKGIKGSTGTHENCRKTQFKKGRAPSEARNYRPIGSLRISKDGYLEQKVNDDAPMPANRWVAVHRLVWEAKHGPVPGGWIVVFVNNSKTNVLEEITPDKLECISRAENARRNHPKNISPEFAKLVQLKGAINRQLNRITKNGTHE